MWPRAIVGALLCVIGGVWILQGVGTLGGSTMTGESQWAVIGSVAVVVGVVLLAAARRRAPRRPDPDA